MPIIFLSIVIIFGTTKLIVKKQAREEYAGGSGTVIEVTPQTVTHVEGFLLGLEPSILGDKLFNLVSGQCHFCQNVMYFSELVKKNNDYLCPNCHLKGHENVTNLFFIFKLIVSSDSNDIVILAVDDAAEKFLGVSVAEFLSCEEVSMACWRKIQFLIHSSSGDTNKIRLKFTICIANYGQQTVPVLIDSNKNLQNFTNLN